MKTRAKPTPFLERLAAVTGGEDECWVWPTQLRKGYGRVFAQGRYMPAHRAAYEALIGPIADGLVLDHMCRNRACVNPNHLDVVTAGVNVLRGVGRTARQKRQTHCKRGHPLSGENLYEYRGARTCKACRRVRAALRNEANPEEMRRRRAASWALHRERHDPVIRARISDEHCYQGHELTPENTYLYGSTRGCRTCRRVRTTEWQRERRRKAK